MLRVDGELPNSYRRRMDIIIRRPTTNGSFVDMVLPATASPADQRRWLVSSLTAAAKVRGTSLFTDADLQVYVDGELDCTVGRQANVEALVERLLPEEDIDSRVYGDGR